MATPTIDILILFMIRGIQGKHGSRVWLARSLSPMVTPVWAELVPGWVTTWEDAVLCDNYVS